MYHKHCHIQGRRRHSPEVENRVHDSFEHSRGAGFTLVDSAGSAEPD